MQYDDIIKYFSSEEKIIELFNKLKSECFDVIDDYASQAVSGILTTTEELRKAKTQLSGIIAYLQPIYSKAMSLKKQEEYRYFSRAKANQEKFSAATEVVLAKDFVKNFRDARDIIYGYIKSAEALLYDFKDNIEQNRNEYQRTKQES